MDELVLVPWRDEYQLGIAQIDEQHKKILSLVNRSYDIFEKKKYNDPAELEAILKEMMDYTIYHFQTEEKYFNLYGYEKTASHTEIHNQYRTRVAEWRELYHKDKDNRETVTQIFFEISKFLHDWWIWHINNTDRDYVPFMKANHIA